jgi:drug/metabolite transporter (DMT)-like permease
MIVIAIIEYAILASTFTIAKITVGYCEPLFLIGVRMVVSAPLLFLIHALQKESSFKIERSDYKRFFSASIFHIFLPFVGEFWALQFISSSKTAIIYSLSPFIAAIFSYFLLKKKFIAKQFLGLMIGLLGLMPILFSQDDITRITKEFAFVSLPELVLLLSVIAASYAWFIVSDLMKRGYGISLINGVAMFLGGIFSLSLWLVLSDGHNPIKGDFKSFFLWMTLLILVANVISYNLYGWLLKHLSITFMSAIGFLCPIFASIYGLLLLKEKLTFNHLLALVLVCTGLWIFYREEMKITERY